MVDDGRSSSGAGRVSGVGCEPTGPGSRERPADLWGRRPIGLTKHEAAVRRSLAWADEAAALLDYAGALLWLAAIEATGDQLPLEYRGKQNAWALEAQEAHHQP